jgi:hypothetical protein
MLMNRMSMLNIIHFACPTIYISITQCLNIDYHMLYDKVLILNKPNIQKGTFNIKQSYRA